MILEIMQRYFYYVRGFVEAKDGNRVNRSRSAKEVI